MKTLFLRREQIYGISSILCEGDPISHYIWCYEARHVSEQNPRRDGSALSRDDLTSVLDPLKWVRFSEAQAYILDVVKDRLSTGGLIRDILDIPEVRAAFDGSPPPPPPKPPPTNYKIGVPKNKLP